MDVFAWVAGDMVETVGTVPGRLMPGPTSKGTYDWWAAEKIKAGVFPNCDVCHRPMVCGQETWNRGAHVVCADRQK